LLTLVVVPVAYTYLDNWGKRALRFFKGQPKTSGLERALPAAAAD
jgi:hypothetical protein